MDWGSWPAIIALIVAIVSPYITTVLHQRHDRKIKGLEIGKRRMEVMEGYLESATIFISHFNDEKARDEYISSHFKLLLYVSDSVIGEMNCLFNLLIEEKNNSGAFRVLEKTAASMYINDKIYL